MRSATVLRLAARRVVKVVASCGSNQRTAVRHLRQLLSRVVLGYGVLHSAQAQAEKCGRFDDLGNCPIIVTGRPVDLGPQASPEGAVGLSFCYDTDQTDSCFHPDTGDAIRISATTECFGERWVVNKYTRARGQLIGTHTGGCGQTVPFETTAIMPDLSHDYHVTATLTGPTEALDVGDPIHLTLHLSNPAPWRASASLDTAGNFSEPGSVWLNDRPVGDPVWGWYYPTVYDSLVVEPSDTVWIEPYSSVDISIQCRVTWPGRMKFRVMPRIGDYISYIWGYDHYSLHQLEYISASNEAYVDIGHLVQIQNIEPVQVVYNAPLVAQKPTLVRVTIENRQSEPVTERVLVAMPHGAGNANEKAFAIEEVVFSPGITKLLLPRSDWLLPDAAGDVVVSIDPDIVDAWPNSGSGTAPKTFRKQVQVKTVRPLKLQFVPLRLLDWPPSSASLWQFADDSREFLNAIFPMPPLPDGSSLLSPITATCSGTASDAADLMESMARTAPGVERFVGLLPMIGNRTYYEVTGSPAQLGEASPPPGKLGTVVSPYDVAGSSSSVIVAHELGHTLGLPLWGNGAPCPAWEEYCAPGVNCSRAADWGVWVEGRAAGLTDDQIDTIKVKVEPNFMGCSDPPGFRTGTRIDRWIARDDYEHLLEELSSGARKDPEVLTVNGTIQSDGSVRAGPWFRCNSDQPSRPESSGEYAIVFRDSQNAEIGRFAFSWPWRFLDPPPPNLPEEASFSFAVPTVPGIASVQIYHDIDLLYERPVTPAAPSVTIVAPIEGETFSPGESHTTSWSAADADGDELFYTVLFSSDNGSSWVPMALNAQATSLEWTVPDLDTTCARIRVRGTDGINTTEATSGCFSIAGTSAAPLIARPGHDQTTAPGEPVQLDGTTSLNSNGAAIDLAWQIVGSPAAGDAHLDNETTATPTFTAWTPGRYLISLVITDGTRTSSPAYVVVTVTGTNPTHRKVVLSVGANSSGQLGIGSTSTPAPVPIGRVAAVAGGSVHSLALRMDGTVWAWGYNYMGQLGDGTTADRGMPVQVLNLADVGAVSAGQGHNLALRNDGTVWAWGDNSRGQLGDGTTQRRTGPVRAGQLTGVIAVAAGGHHSLALTSDGTVWAWGGNYRGQLGDDTTVDRNSPAPVAELSNVTAIAAGPAHSLALGSDGTVRAWGHNEQGALGDTTMIDRHAPVQVSGLGGVISIASGATGDLVGGTCSLAIRSDGTVWAWGDNRYGQLGRGRAGGQSNFPVEVFNATDAVAVTGGGACCMALQADGTVWGWGYPDNGQLGDQPSHPYTPEPISGLLNMRQVAAGGDHVLAIDPDGTVWSWGQNQHQQLGHAAPGARSTTPVQVEGLTGPVSVFASGTTNLAIRADQTLWGWGSNAGRQLLFSSKAYCHAPVRATDLDNIIAAVGSEFVLSVCSDHTLWAWGFNSSGQLGIGTTALQHEPARVQLPADVTAVAAGTQHTLMLRSDGTVWGSGDNHSGQLGLPDTGSVSAPVQIPGLTDVRAIAAGADTLAVKSDGTVWGCGYFLGRTVRQVAGLDSVLAVAAGSNHNLALRSDGTLKAWGYNYQGQLGDGTNTNSSTPVQVQGLVGVLGIAAGYQHSLAYTSDGKAWAWGANDSGQLGDGTTIDRSTPVQVLGVQDVSAVAAGYKHSLLLGMLTSAPTVTTVWPANDSCELSVRRLFVNFDAPVLNVSADDLALSGGTVMSVEGNGAGPYVFTVEYLPFGSVTATIAGDITGQSGQATAPYSWTFTHSPGFTQQPASQSVCFGSTVEFTVSADGSTGYQWQKDGAELSDGGHYSGTTTRMLSIADVSDADAGVYRCVVTGCVPLVSSPAVLTLVPPPVITAPPQDQLFCVGDAVRLSITAEGTATFSWRKDGVALSDDSHYSGTATATLTITDVAADDAGSYDCIVMSACPITSSPAALRLLEPGEVAPPQDQVVLAGQTATFTVRTCDPGIGFWWHKFAVAAMNDDERTTGAGTATLTIQDCRPEDQAQYGVLILHQDGASEMGPTARLVVLPDCDRNGVRDDRQLAPGLTHRSQWAAGVITFSSQGGPEAWSAEQTLGEPDTEEYCDCVTAWCPGAENGSRESIALSFDSPVLAEGVTIRETFGNGMVYQVDLVDMQDQLHSVWTGVDPSLPGTPVDFRLEWPTTDYLVKGVKIYVDTDHDVSWEEIDAVQLYGVDALGDCNANALADACEIAAADPDLFQWADKVLAVSSVAPMEAFPEAWAPRQMIGAANTFFYGDLPTAWSPPSLNGTIEFITLGFPRAVHADGAVIRETFGNGMVSQIDLLDVRGQVHTVWAGVDPSQPGEPVDFAVTWPRTAFPVKGIKIYVDTDHDPGWEELDAVQLHGAATSTDCNANGIPDECEPDADGDAVPNDCDLCSETPADVQVDDQGCPAGPACTQFLPADLDRNCLVDFRDFARFVGCHSGPGIPITPESAAHCSPVDFDEDGDIDQSDFGTFQLCITGLDGVPGPDCPPMPTETLLPTAPAGGWTWRYTIEVPPAD